MNSLQFIMQYIRRHKFQYLGGILALFVVDAANVLLPRITGAVTDGLTARTIDRGGIFTCLAALLIVGLLIALGRFFWRYFIFGASRSIEKELRNDMFAHLEQMSVEYYNEHKIGDLMTRFTSDLNTIHNGVGPAVITVFDAVVMTVMILASMIFYVDLRLTLLVLIPMVLIILGDVLYGKAIHTRHRERQEALSDLTDFIQESFSGVHVIKAFVRERHEIDRFKEVNSSARAKNLKVVNLQAIVSPLLEVIINLSILITLIYGGYLALIGEITLGRFVAFNQYINMMVWPMIACGDCVQMFSQASASIRRVQEILDEKPQIPDPALQSDNSLHENDDMQQSGQPDELYGNITLSHLTFVHADHDEPTLDDINIDIPAGTTLAIIGRTGNGKSTLVNLLLHLYNIDPGMIFFDGRDINDIPLKTLRENIAYVPQDNFLFSDTLKANIAFGSEEATTEEIEDAAKAACIHDNIEEFPDKYDTFVGERGVTLSGGQKQRSSIARALLKDAPILILDDALSAVDTDTEKQILENLKSTRSGRTNIIIAHRISTIQNADVIVVLEEGRAVEMGTHDELIALGGIYKSMFDKQQLEAAIGEVREKEYGKEADVL